MYLVMFLIMTACALFLVLSEFKNKYELKDAYNFNQPFMYIIIACIVYFLADDISIALISSVILYIGKRLLSVIKSNQRQIEYSNQLVDALRSLASSIQAGLSLSQAINGIVEELPNPLGKEFMLVQLEITLGSSINDALEKMSQRCKNNDINLFVTALRIQSQTGGNLTPILNNISMVIRERQKLSEKLNAATAQGKLSGLVIASIPPFMIVIIQTIQPGYFDPLIKTSAGVIISIMMLTMNIVGGAWILKISSSRYIT